MSVNINELKVGEEAEIEGFSNTDNNYRKRLLSMGLNKGVKIRLMKIAPLGNPVELEVRGFKLSLRKDEAEALVLRRIQ